MILTLLILSFTVILIPLHVVPVGGLFVVAAFKALDTAHHLHKPVCVFCVFSFIYIKWFIVLQTKEHDKGANCSFYC
jgi:hypothetical protein